MCRKAENLHPSVGRRSTSNMYAAARGGLEEVVDAVVTDPPYGVRAGARKSVHLPYKSRVPGRDHFPHTDPYTLAECLADLLESAARLLRIGGRLVYFLPVGPAAASCSRS